MTGYCCQKETLNRTITSKTCGLDKADESTMWSSRGMWGFAQRSFETRRMSRCGSSLKEPRAHINGTYCSVWYSLRLDHLSEKHSMILKQLERIGNNLPMRANLDAQWVVHHADNAVKINTNALFFFQAEKSLFVGPLEICLRQEP